VKEISDVTFCVVDSGAFLSLAHCLAEKAKHVFYWSPDMRAFPSLKQDYIGDGFEKIDRLRHFWPHLKEIDCFVFPDINQGPLQVHLEEECGKAVWGSRDGDFLETERERFLRVLQKVGLEVPPHKVVVGLTELSQLLEDERDKYIKISRYRGDLETYHWREWDLDNGWLHWLGVNFGSLKEHIRFLVFDEIKTDLEIGGDTFNVRGNWPKKMLNGIEWKDKSYFSAVTDTPEMPQQIRDVMDGFGPILGKYGYANQWSMEVRVQGDKAYFIDATCRGGLPSSGSQQLIWKNFPEIIWAGANGELVEPEPIAQYTIETMITTKADKDSWQDVVIDPALIPWARFSYCGQVGNTYAFPPDEYHAGELGWLVAIGDTTREALDHAKELADMLPDGLNADVEALAGVIKEIESAAEQGIKVVHDEMPDPAEVLE
jgi:hypothetical protein